MVSAAVMAITKWLICKSVTTPAPLVSKPADRGLFSWCVSISHPARDLDSLPATTRSAVEREPRAHELDHLLDREAVCEHHGLSAAVAAGDEQFEGAAAVRLGAVPSA